MSTSGRRDAISRDEATQIIKAGFGAAMEQIAAHCTTPIFWYDDAAPQGSRLQKNGTIFFVKLDRLVGITADLVYQGFLNDLEKTPTTTAAIFEIDFPLRDRLIARSSKFDIAIFAIDERELRRIHKVAHEPSRGWPPPRPQRGQGVMFYGFPGLLREEEGFRLYWKPYFALTVATVVGEDRVVLQLEREHIIDAEGPRVPPANLWLGGMSGCPLFALCEYPVVHVCLAGVGIEFNESLEIARFAPIQTLLCNGELSE
jgi:hypothetical protein